jgi:serine/threonine-protein kinase
MLLPQWMDEPTLVQRFAREGRASAAIRSEHIVRVMDVDESNGRPYLVLERLDGQDLDKLVSEGGPLPVAFAVELVLQACEALADAHAIGTIHRDLKPANLFLTHKGDGSPCLKVLDFGISKITSTSPSRRTSISGRESTQPLTVMGSPQYMSPEQMQSSDVDERSDIWSLGAILHELLAGRPPFEGESITEVCAHVMTDPPPSLTHLRNDVPAGLEAVVRCCLEKERGRRYSNVAELARALAPFGPETGYASMETISRVLEGGIARARPSPGPHTRVEASPTSAVSRVSSRVSLPAGVARPIGGYLLATIAALGLVGAVAWKVAKQESAIRDAERASSPANEAPQVAKANELAVPSGALAPSSVTSTSGAHVEASALPAVPVPPSPPFAPRAGSPAPVPRVVRREPRRASVSAEGRASSPPTERPATPVPPPRAISETPASPDQLFDQRK